MNAKTVNLRPSPELLRLVAAGFVALLLQIPIARIAGLVSERQGRMDIAVAEVTEKSGRSQTINGPFLILPYTQTLSISGSRKGEFEAVLMPESLSVSGNIDTESLQRGIFSIPVYTADLKLEGRFEAADLQTTNADLDTIDWSRAKLALGISEVRTLQSLARLTWDGETYDFLPGPGSSSVSRTGIHVPLALDDEGLGAGVDFAFPLTLTGSQGLYFMPNGRSNRVDLQGDSGFVSFQGRWLPSDRALSDTSFSASWAIPHLARDYPQAWTISQQSQAPTEEALSASRFGVDLLSPIDAYRATGRSVKYAGLFLIMTFALVWLLEVLAGLRVHPIQYLLLGAAMCVFYLLELSLAEHLPFAQGYLLAGLAVVLLGTGYGAVMLRRWRRAALLGTALSGLYAYLYIVLTNEDHALLVGSLGLLLALALIMYSTRNVDWFAPQRRRSGETPGEQPSAAD